MKSCKKLFKKIVNRETILYGIVGVGTSVLNVTLFQLLLFFQMNYKIANFITLIIVKLAAYICNKNLVFQSKCNSWLELGAEFGRFVIFRGATMILDYVGLIVLVDFLHIDKLIGKCIVTVLVIIINYFTGKSHVFKNTVK